jgi:glutamate carboxypeptidase
MSWSNINSGSFNIDGLARQLHALQESFAALGGDIKVLPLAPHAHFDDTGNPVTDHLGKALSITKHPMAKKQILLGGHMDTVFHVHSPFQFAKQTDAHTIVGPGVCDMKSGLVIMLTALQALEASPFAEEIGWQVFITPDEEIGSPGSTVLWKEAAKHKECALLFEPAFHDGSLVSERGGSANYFLKIKGISAHAGRDFTKGISALIQATDIIQELHRLNTRTQGDAPERIVNIGQLLSGTGYNIVPDTAICKINIRASTKEIMQELKSTLLECVQKHQTRDITIELQEMSNRCPKPFDEKTKLLFSHIASCADLLQFPLHAKPTRGVSDGNLLAECGLPTIDSLGAIGGGMHTYSEYIHIDSLIQRAQLTALFLMRLARGDFDA